MSIASLSTFNQSTTNTRFEGEFSSSSYTSVANGNINYNRAFYTISKEIVNATYNFNITSTAANTAVQVKLPVPQNTTLANINDIYFSATLIQSGSSTAYPYVASIVAGDVLFTFTNPLPAGNIYNALIEIIYKIDQ